MHSSVKPSEAKGKIRSGFACLHIGTLFGLVRYLLGGVTVGEAEPCLWGIICGVILIRQSVRGGEVG